METYECLVIGGGPAGASFAKNAECRGITTVVFDGSFPRRKPCAGGLTISAVGELPALPKKLVEGKIDGVVFRMGERSIRVPYNGNGCTVQRDEFDKWLLGNAIGAGATHVKSNVKGFERHGENFWVVETQEGEEYKGKYLIGADGASSIVRKELIGSIPKEHMYMGMGYYVKRKTKKKGCDIEFILGKLREKREGYIWIFPKKNETNVGIVYPLGTAGLKNALDDFIEERGFGGGEYYAHVIPWARDDGFFRNQKIAGKNWLLIGDAAGHVSAVHGEGIKYALIDGRIAASAIEKHHCEDYGIYWQEAYGKDMMFDARFLRKVVYNRLLMNFAFKTFERSQRMRMIIEEGALGNKISDRNLVLEMAIQIPFICAEYVTTPR